MKHVNALDCEQQKEFLCQSCDEAFFHTGTQEPVCPKCGLSGTKWLLCLPTQDPQRRETTNSVGEGEYEEEVSIEEV